MSNDEKKAKAHELQLKRNKVMLSFLCKFYPNLFTEDKKNIKPLQNKIFFLIRQDFIKKNLLTAKTYWKKYGYAFLRWYTSQLQYHVAVLRNKTRFGLNGQVAEVLIKDHKNYSYTEIQNAISRISKQNNPKVKKMIRFLMAICKKYNWQRQNTRKFQNHAYKG